VVKNKSDFELKANIVHCYKYNYSLFEYINSRSKSIIICPIHGKFSQAPNNHLNGNGCPKCAEINRRVSKSSTTEIFIEKAKIIHGNRYDYTKTIYVHTDKNVLIICKEHGEFWQIPYNHLSGRGCYLCGVRKRSSKLRDTKEGFIEKSNQTHNNFYDYSNFEYKNAITKSIIICPKHGEFKQSANSHLSGHGCPNCKYKNQQIVNDFLQSKCIKFNNFLRLTIKNKLVICDFYIPSLNLIIEYNGEQHYHPVRFDKKATTNKSAEENLKKQQERDSLLRNYCTNNKIYLLEIDGRKYYGMALKEYLGQLDLEQIVLSVTVK
jgi:hypothetical protein